MKLDSLLKLAVAFGVRDRYGNLYTTEKRTLNIDMNKLCPEARAEVYRRCAEAWEEVRQELEDKLKTMRILPAYRDYRENGKTIRVSTVYNGKSVLEVLKA